MERHRHECQVNLTFDRLLGYYVQLHFQEDKKYDDKVKASDEESADQFESHKYQKIHQRHRTVECIQQVV